MFDWPRHLLEGDTSISREWREQVDAWWSEKLNIKDFTPRYALQLVGTDALRNNFNQDIWFLTLQNRVRKNPNQDIVISDVRFPNELKFIKEQNGILVQIHRGQLPEWFNTAIHANDGNLESLKMMKTKFSSIHHSEWAWAGSHVDFSIDNNGSVDDLKDEINSILSFV